MSRIPWRMPSIALVTVWSAEVMREGFSCMSAMTGQGLTLETVELAAAAISASYSGNASNSIRPANAVSRERLAASSLVHCARAVVG